MYIISIYMHVYIYIYVHCAPFQLVDPPTCGRSTDLLVVFLLALQHVFPGINMSGPFIALRRFVGTAGVPKSLKSWETVVLY